jgi:hypothetical protein
MNTMIEDWHTVAPPLLLRASLSARTVLQQVRMSMLADDGALRAYVPDSAIAELVRLQIHADLVCTLVESRLDIVGPEDVVLAHAVALLLDAVAPFVERIRACGDAEISLAALREDVRAVGTHWRTAERLCASWNF